MSVPSRQQDGLVRNLGRLADLEPEDIAALEALPWRAKPLRAGAPIATKKPAVQECHVLFSGYACRYNLADDGRRQILSFHVAGDLLDVEHLFFDKIGYEIQAISDAEVGVIEIEAWKELVRDRPRLATGLWRLCMTETSIAREWIFNLGRRSGPVRVAHLICEFMTRCEAAGLSAPDTTVLPMTQEHIGDATGLTDVHVNRVLRQLRELGLLIGSGRAFKVGDWTSLQKFADFRPDYLHLSR